MATTLERIEDAEKQLKSLGVAVSALQMAKDVSGIAQEQEDGNTKAVAQLANNRSLSLEISLTELAKTITALTACLIEAKVVTGQAIMDRIIKMNQDEDMKEIDNLVESKLLIKSNEVKPHSFVIASHTIVDLKNPESSKLVMEKRVLRLPTSLVSEQLRKDLTGRKVGDQVQVNKTDDGKVHVLTVKEIYDLNEKEVVQMGEAALHDQEER